MTTPGVSTISTGTTTEPSRQTQQQSRGPRSNRRIRGRGYRQAGQSLPRRDEFPPQNREDRPRSPTQNHLTLRPSSIPPVVESTSNSQSPHHTSHPPNNRGRGQATGRAGRFLSESGHPRSFARNLTQQAQKTSHTLQTGAPDVVTGQRSDTLATLAKSEHSQKSRRRKLSKSNAQDIATRIQEDIKNGQYECPICTNEVLRNSKVWSCQTCWTVFHLGCIKQWSSNADSAVQQQPNEESPAPRHWRCPGCNLPQDVRPSRYTCWCSKEEDPRTINGLPPHSCGQTCGRPRISPKKCPHGGCPKLCHAGPCPPCTYMGPVQSCYCGKTTKGSKCVDTDYEAGWSCGTPCGDLMLCGEHQCSRPCHEGLCDACEVQIAAQCYCGREKALIPCCDRDDKPSKRSNVSDSGEHVTEEWIGHFQCSTPCRRDFDCGKHKCEKPCHALDSLPAHCPRSPDVAKRCPCQKTSLDDLLDSPRTSCEDAIPRCFETCKKKLPCGHLCESRCHSGPCRPCLQTVIIHCRCQKTANSSICHQGTEEAPQCTRICRANLNCGRHQCGERCCPGELKASERQATKRKLRPLGTAALSTAEDFELEHICTRLCGRPLKCGNHNCDQLCHKGPCGTCQEAIFEEVACSCGRTVLSPPLPCGTEPPPCRWDCERPKMCSHTQVKHNCHPDSLPCPKCPFLTEKLCMCKKKVLRNIPCSSTQVRCGTVCGRKLSCGLHLCRRTCHAPGECETGDGGGKCTQICGRPKKICGHPCDSPCHAPYPCTENKPCPHKVLITCSCQNRKQEARCNVSTSMSNNVSDVNTSDAARSLPCDDECARLERNRKLALALDIDPLMHTDDYIPYSEETLSLYQNNIKWAEDQEREFRVFAVDEAEKRLRFKPMSGPQRSFLHALAGDFGLDSESMDPEPLRCVVVFKTPRFVSAPSKTLRDCIRIQQRLNAEDAATEKMARNQVGAVGSSGRTAEKEMFNGFLVTSPRFGLTLEELHSAVDPTLTGNTQIRLDTYFLPSGDVLLAAMPEHITGTSASQLDTAIRPLKSSLARAISIAEMGHLQLCRYAQDPSSDSPVIASRESDFAPASAAEGGWSQVAAKAAAPRKAPRAPDLGARSGFAVLSTAGRGTGSASAATKKRKEKEKKAREKAKGEFDVVESWEKEMEEEEEQRIGAVEQGGDVDDQGTVDFNGVAVADEAVISTDTQSDAVADAADPAPVPAPTPPLASENLRTDSAD